MFYVEREKRDFSCTANLETRPGTLTTEPSEILPHFLKCMLCDLYHRYILSTTVLVGYY